MKNPVSLVSMRPGLIQHISTDARNLCDVNRELSLKKEYNFIIDWMKKCAIVLINVQLFQQNE